MQLARQHRGLQNANPHARRGRPPGDDRSSFNPIAPSFSLPVSTSAPPHPWFAQPSPANPSLQSRLSMPFRSTSSATVSYCPLALLEPSRLTPLRTVCLALMPLGPRLQLCYSPQSESNQNGLQPGTFRRH